MKDSKKASDIFNETDYVLSKKVGFEEAFPQIKDFVIEVSEYEDAMWGKEVRTRMYAKNEPPGEFVDCSNPVCYSGGVSIGDVLRSMVRNKVADETATRKCRGYEGSPKGRKRYRSCMHSFTVKVSLQYKTS